MMKAGIRRTSVSYTHLDVYKRQDDGRADGRDRTGGQTISIYGDIILPNVQDAKDFGESMRQYLQGEISMMEGMA